MLQPCSSEPSSQSAVPSHCLMMFTHLPVLQANSFSLQVHVPEKDSNTNITATNVN